MPHIYEPDYENKNEHESHYNPITILCVCTRLNICILPALVKDGCRYHRRPQSRCYLQACCCSLTLAAGAVVSVEPGGTARDPPLIVSLPTNTHNDYCAHRYLFISMNQSSVKSLCFSMSCTHSESVTSNTGIVRKP